MAGVPLVLAQAPARLAFRDAVAYLALMPQQVASLTRIEAAFQADLRARSEEAARLATTQAAEAEALCRRSVQQAESARESARAVLTESQRVRLAELEQAFAAMPAVESAQSALLLSPVLVGTPRGLPAGSVQIEFTYRRDAAPLPPGCVSSQTVRPGIERVTPAKR